MADVNESAPLPQWHETQDLELPGWDKTTPIPDVKGTNPDVGLLKSVDVGFGLSPENPVGQATLKIVDLPTKYGLRLPLEFIHSGFSEENIQRQVDDWGKFIQEPGAGAGAPEAFVPSQFRGLIEPHRAYSEKQWEEAPEELKSTIPEAFAPLPSKEVFVPVAETALMFGAPAMRGIDMLSQISKAELLAGLSKGLGQLKGKIPYEFMEDKQLLQLLQQIKEQETTNAGTDAAKAGTPSTEEVLRAASTPVATQEGFPPLPSAAVVEGEPALSSKLVATPIENRTILEALGVPDRYPPSNELLQAALGSGELRMPIRPNFPKDTDVGSIRPITFGTGENVIETGYKARVLDADTGLYTEKYLTKDGKVAQGITLSTDEFGSHVDYLNSEGKVIARTTADSPEAVLQLGKASRLSSYEEAADPSISFKGGRVSTFTAQDIESGQPTLVVVQEGEGAISTSGPAIKLAEDGPLISPQVDPTLDIMGIPREGGWRDTLEDLTLTEFGKAREPGQPYTPKPDYYSLPALSENIKPIPERPGVDVYGWTGGVVDKALNWSRDVFAKVLNPNTYFRIYFGFENPFLDGIRQVTRSLVAKAEALNWKEEIMTGVADATQAIKDAWLPQWKQFREESRAVTGRIITAQHDARGTKDPALKGALETQRDAAIAEFKELWKPYAKSYYTIMNNLAKEHADVRIAFLVEPQEGINIINATDNEKKIAEQIRAFYQSHKLAAEAQEMSTREGAYISRLYLGRDMRHDPDIMEMFQETKPIFDKEYKSGYLAETDFASRIEGAPNMFPSAHACLNNYINNRMPKIAARAWENKWDEVLNNSNSYIRDYSKRFHDNLWSSQQQSTLDPMVDLFRRVVYTKGVAFSIQTMMKHLVGKMPLTASYIGVGKTLEALPATVEMLSGVSPELVRARETFLAVKWILQSVMDNPHINAPFQGRIATGLSKFERAGMFPTAGVEYLENGLNLIGSVMKAHKLNFDYNAAINAIYESASFANFRGGIGHAPWTQTPGGKLASIFQWTVQSMAENIGYTWAQAGKNIYRGITGQPQGTTVWGENWGLVAARQLILYGGAELAAQAFTGRSLGHLMFHIPYYMGSPGAQLYEEASHAGWQAVHKAENMSGIVQGPVAFAGGLGGWWLKNWALYSQIKKASGDYPKDIHPSAVDAVLGVRQGTWFDDSRRKSTNPWK